MVSKLPCGFVYLLVGMVPGAVPISHWRHRGLFTDIYSEAWTKWLTYCRQYIKMTFCYKKYWYHSTNVPEHNSWRSNHHWNSTGSENGLMLNWWQAIIWTNNNSWFMHIKYHQGTLRKYSAPFVNMSIWADNIRMWYKLPILLYIPVF